MGTYLSKLLVGLLVVTVIAAPVAGTAAANGAAGPPAVSPAEGASVGSGQHHTETAGGITDAATDGSVPIDDASSDGPNATTETTDVDDRKLGETVDRKVDHGPRGELVPVLVVFERQPDDGFGLDRLSGTPGKAELKAFAKEVQGETRRYLEREAQEGDAADVHGFWMRNVVAVKATPGTIRSLAKRPGVARVVYDRTYRLNGNSSTAAVREFVDEFDEYGTLTAPHGFEGSTAGERAWHLDYLGADDVQERNVTGAGVNVSVVDTGIDASHPALNGSVTKWKDFSSEGLATPQDPVGHGTHVAGLVAGRAAERTVGVAPEANLFGAKVFTDSGSARTSDILRAFEWSAENHADVISASLGSDPIADEYGGQQQVATGGTGTTNVTVYRNATAANFSSSTSLDAYKPGFVLVGVVPERVNGSDIDDVDRTRAQVMRNLSVGLRGPTGSTQLVRRPATWMFDSGEVPDEVGIYKFKPGDRTTLAPTGNWSLRVDSTSDTTVAYNYTVLPVYTSNGSGEVEKFVDSLAITGDVVPVIAAGNSGATFGNRSIGSPATAETAITVGASAREVDDVAPFSGRGPVGFGSAARPGVDIVAPGVEVPSAYPESGRLAACEAPYCALSGTSMATPLVSGTVALLLSERPSLSRTEVTTALTSTAQRPHAPDNAFGAGVLDTWAAVNGTVGLADRAVSTETGVHELYAGIGETGETRVYRELDPVVDPADVSGGPDLYATNRVLKNRFTVAFREPDTSNVTLRVHVDVDRNDSTGAPNAGSEYRVTVERAYWNGAFRTATSFQEYNGSTGAWERTTNVTAEVSEVSAQFVRLRTGSGDGTAGLQFAPGVNASTYDWHVTASPMDASAVDRLPDQGQVRTPPSVPVDGVAVAWNATAGRPAADEPIRFGLYASEDATEPVATETVRTNGSGVASTTLPLRFADVGFEVERLRITDAHGNEVVQEYDVDDVSIENWLDDRQDGASTTYTAPGFVYEIERNRSLTLNVPLSRLDSGTVDTYNGTASVRLGEGLQAAQYYHNGTSVEDGVLRVTVPFDELRIDDETEYGVNVEVSLTDTFDPTQAFTVGGVWWMADAQTRLGPRGAVAAPGEPVNFTFQNTKEVTFGAQRAPLNASTRVTVRWFADREYATLLSAVSPATARELRTASSDDGLSTSARSELERVVSRSSDLDPDAIATETMTGNVTPTDRGVGTFGLSVPDDARFGIVTARPNAPGDVGGDLSPIVVDDRLDPYRRTPTQPDETTRYDLRVDTDWGVRERDGLLVPEENFSVEVALYDRQNETRVDGATVSLYTTDGAVTRVTTNGSQPVAVPVAAPDLDYRNGTYLDREQQLLAVAHDARTADGTALSETDTVNGFVDAPTETSDAPYADVALSRSSADRLTTTVTYRNRTTGERVNETPTTLLRLGSPDAQWGINRDLLVDFVRPGANPARYNVSAPAPTDVARQYEASARTASMASPSSDSLDLAGPTATVDLPDVLTGGADEPVTVRVTDRNGDPIPNAVVVWNSQVFAGTGDPGADRLPPAIDGVTHAGRTNASGVATLTVEHSLPEGASERGISYAVGLVTDNASVPELERGRVGIRQITGPELVAGTEAPATAIDERVSVTGRAENLGSDLAANATVRLQYRNDSAVGWTTLNETTVDVAPGESLELTGTFDRGTTDGFADNYTVRTVVDATGVVSEADETNNVSTRFVDGAPLVTGRFDVAAPVDLTGEAVVALGPDREVRLGDVAADGSFVVGVSEGNVTFSYGGWDEANATVAPRDGVVDQHEVAVRTVGSSLDLGTLDVPNGSVLDVRVVDGAGEPVGNATVSVASDRIPSEQDIRYVGDTRPDGHWSVRPDGLAGVELNGTAEIELLDVPSGYEGAGQRERVNVTGPQTAVFEVNRTASSGDGNVSVRLAPDPTYAATNGTTEVDVLVDGVDAGVGGYNLTVDLADPSVATVANATVAGAPAVVDVHVADDGSSVELNATGGDTGNGTVRVATVRLRGESAGNTTANVTAAAVHSEDGAAYTVTGTAGTTVDVSALDPVDPAFSGPPTDPDDDGHFEDVNGDGAFDVTDVQALFDHRSSPEVTTMHFDFNDDGRIDVVDVQYLFATITGGN